MWCNFKKVISRRNLIYLYSLFGCLSVMSSCSNEDDVPTTAESTNHIVEEENFEPVVFTTEDPTHEIILDGKPVTFTLNTGIVTKSVEPRIDFTEIGPLPAGNPYLARKGDHQKYTTGRYPQFDFLPSYTYVVLRLDEFRFVVDLPKDAALDGAYELTPLTTQGFTTNSPNYQGYTLVSKISHINGYKLTFQFFIQSGSAYDILGRRLTADMDYPISGANVKYNYVYYKKK